MQTIHFDFFRSLLTTGQILLAFALLFLVLNGSCFISAVFYPIQMYSLADHFCYHAKSSFYILLLPIISFVLLLSFIVQSRIYLFSDNLLYIWSGIGLHLHVTLYFPLWMQLFVQYLSILILSIIPWITLIFHLQNSIGTFLPKTSLIMYASFSWLFLMAFRGSASFLGSSLFLPDGLLQIISALLQFHFVNTSFQHIHLIHPDIHGDTTLLLLDDIIICILAPKTLCVQQDHWVATRPLVQTWTCVPH